jgi:hypothetical protein
LIDSQYPRVIGETGIIGLWIFIWLMITILQNSMQVLKTVQDDWERGLTLGFLAGFIGWIHWASGSWFCCRHLHHCADYGAILVPGGDSGDVAGGKVVNRNKECLTFMLSAFKI